MPPMTTTSSAPRAPRFFGGDQAHAAHDARQEIGAGLQAPVASISPKYFYDSLGSKLFEAICELPEYYPTRTEAAIFDEHLPDIAAALPRGATLVDLGAGNSAKAARLFAPLEVARYVAVDVSLGFLRESLTALQQRFATLDIRGVGADFSQRLALPAQALEPAGAPRVLFYPGSSIGNFDPADAQRLLREIRALCAAAPGSGLLIGVDLVKDRRVLEAAYDDALGVTAAFNLNALRHLNDLAGTDFDLRDWRHVAAFDPVHSRIQMHLQARRALTVCWPDGQRRFAADERIHTENSYKWTPASFEALLRDAGFARVRRWSDADQAFALWWAKAG
jgi:dimethylhistidine N-methyltransferase